MKKFGGLQRFAFVCLVVDEMDKSSGKEGCYSLQDYFDRVMWKPIE